MKTPEQEIALLREQVRALSAEVEAWREGCYASQALSRGCEKRIEMAMIETDMVLKKG